MRTGDIRLSQVKESRSAGNRFATSPPLLKPGAGGPRLRMSDRVSWGVAKLKGALLSWYLGWQKAVGSLACGVAARAERRRRTGTAALRQLELERQRLGRELHTGVGQTLAAMRLQLDVISRHCPEPGEEARAALDRLSVLAGAAAEQVRGLSQRLHPPEWQRLTMEDAVRQLWELSGMPQSLQASMRIEPLPQQPGLPVKVLVYRALQEALSNVARHSRATAVEAVLESRGGRLWFTIQDNGVGFDVAALERAPASVASGIGLRSIREQAASLDARLDVESGPKGTKLTLSAPFMEEWH